MGVLDDFRDIRDTMLWKEAALDQLVRFEALAGRLGVPLTVAGSHTSKSISLPVVRLFVNNNIFLLRDNFGDVNLCVLSHSKIGLSFSEMLDGVCKVLDWDWYLGEIAKCRGYTWDYFTDEEMDDPRILRVVKPHKRGNPGDKPIEWTVRADQKDRWLKRMIDPAWYCKDWSSGMICWEGEFGPGVKLFVQHHPFAEGIEKLVPRKALEPYSPGTTMFALALGSMEQAELIIRRAAGL